MVKNQKRFVALASGAGSTLDFLLQAQERGGLKPRLEHILTDNPQAGARNVAKKYALEFSLISPKDFQSFEEWDRALAIRLQSLNPDFILLAGFLKKIGPEVLRAFDGKMVNTHPSLLPKFGGKGMYGRRVHEAVVAAGERETGVTIHLVNENFDEGPVLKQVRVAVSPGESVESVEDKVKKAEKAALLEFLNEER